MKIWPIVAFATLALAAATTSNPAMAETEVHIIASNAIGDALQDLPIHHSSQRSDMPPATRSS